MNRRVGFAAPAVALAAVLPNLATAQARHEFAEVHLGVRVRVVLHAPDTARARRAARIAFDRMAELEDRLSDYRATSELRSLAARPGEWVPVSVDLYRVLGRALALARASGGAFDPTVGPVVALWREARRTGLRPEPRSLDSAAAAVGWTHVRLDSATRSVRLGRPGMALDLGGIAKGYVLDRALEALGREGVTSALLEAGGDIVVGAAPPGRPGWEIAVESRDPLLTARARALVHAAIATSGPTEQFVEIGGRRYSHVVDPRTGRGLSNDLVATVIAPDGATADALATAITVLGERAGGALARRFAGVAVTVRRVPRSGPPPGSQPRSR
jgi:thiamine biosynthesis lipoprotein